jgi:ABC-type polar amino acid transport system ATPase subunit
MNLGKKIVIIGVSASGKSTFARQLGAKTNLHVGSGTIAYVECWLRGLLPDYSKHIKRELKRSTEEKRRQLARDNPLGLTALKLKYPLHFLLFLWPKP